MSDQRRRRSADVVQMLSKTLYSIMSSILYFEANHKIILDFSRNIFYLRIHDQWKKHYRYENR